MKRKFEGHICVYCRRRPAETDDHIFARQLFADERHRANLPKAPACGRCNSQKSQLENYLTAVLPMGSRLGGGVDPNVDKRLRKNLKLARELGETLDAPAQIFADGTVGIRTAFKFRYRHLEEYLDMVSVALAWHHFGTTLDVDCGVAFFDLNDPQASGVDQLFGLQSANRVHNILGEGVVEYRAIQALDDPQLSIWQFRLFGGLALASSDPAFEQDRASTFMVIIGRREFVEGIRADQIAAISGASQAGV